MSKAEEQIRRAMEEGQFDNLPGKGKPLNLDENPYEDPEWRMAHHILHNSGFSLPWIETRREIETNLEAARTSIKTTWDWGKLPLRVNSRSHS
jgi:DnaJ family protein C protein 28